MSLMVPRLTQATIACPYCYETFTARQIMFRCTGRPSRTGQRCELTTDPVLAARVGVRLEKGPAFQPAGLAKGRSNAATCPWCAGVTNDRICPVCHSLLPVQFGSVGSQLIAMAGAKDSGKTVYMTVLIHELKNRIGEQFGAAVMDADEETQRRFARLYEDELYQRGQMFPTTQGARQNEGRVAPLVFRFSMMSDGLLSARLDQWLLSFFDTAGEDFLSRESVEVNARYLACADGILLLLDPLQMRGARQLAAPGTPLPGTGALYENPATILTRTTDLLLSQKKVGKKVQIDKPIAVVFTKMDVLWHTFGDGPLRDGPPQGAGFDTEDSLEVHEEIRHLLRDWEGTQIDQILRHHYSRYRYFGVSALGRAPTAGNEVAPEKIQPYRVADPLLWLLSEFGAVARTRGAR